jgi:uncharacterized protein YndB with AHSA1/START domain
MSTATETRTLQVTRAFAFPPERVFDAWLDPSIASRFLFATPTGEVIRVKLDPRVGGTFNIVRRDNGDEIEHVGEYLVIDRPRRLVFTFAVPRFSTQFTQVAIDIAPTTGGCTLTLTHTGVLPEWAERTQQGWGMILGTLDRRMQDYASVTGAGQVRIERLLPGPIERVWEYITDSEKRSKWLAAGPIEPRVGGAVRFQFLHTKLSPENAPAPEKYREHENKASMTGEVLEWQPPTRLRITWNESAGHHSEALFELSPQEDAVLLVITHRRLPNRNAMVGVGAGWHTHLTVLEDVLRGRTPGAFWNTFNPLEAQYETLIPPNAGNNSTGEPKSVV